MKKDDFGDRMKCYENALVEKVDGSEPVYMRIDGRSFSKFTRSLDLRRPRDGRFEQVFVNATRDVVKEFNFALGFHQSDEVSLFFPVLTNPESQLPFDGKVMKLSSVVASYFTSAFLRHFLVEFSFLPVCSFDARVVQLPTVAEATNMLVWRYKDAERNLIQDIAHHQFGHKVLDGVSTREKHEMIGSPKLYPGNFIKRVDVSENNDTVRHRVDRLTVDFPSLTFDERMNLIYGKISDHV